MEYKTSYVLFYINVLVLLWLVFKVAFFKSHQVSRLKMNVMLGILGLFTGFLISNFVQHIQFQYFNPTPVTENTFLAIAGYFIFADFCFFLNHWLQHKIPFLWRFHRIHHNDQHIDYSTHLRHSPQSIFFSIGLNFIFCSIFNLNFYKFSFFISLIYFYQFFVHSEKQTWLGGLSAVIVTPKYHAQHHRKDIYDIHFGGFLSIWDRLFGLILKPQDNTKNIEYGLFQDPQPYQSEAIFENLSKDYS